MRIPPAVCLAFFSAACHAASLPPGTWADVQVSDEYLLRVWETNDGLSSNTIHSIAQAPDGELWVGTQNGLARFDGESFSTIPLRGGLDKITNNIHALHFSRDGALWIGFSSNGVARKVGGKIEMVSDFSPIRPGVLITSFAEDKSGGVWFGGTTTTQITRWKAGVLTDFTSKEGVGPGYGAFVHADRAGAIWFGTTNGCGVFDGTRFKTIEPESKTRVRMAAAKGGGVWAVRDERRLLRYWSDGRKEEVADLTWLDENVVTTLLEGRNGDVWLGTSSAGVFRFRGGAFVHVPTSHTGIASLFEDSTGNIWVGTIGGGLNRLSVSRFNLVQVKDGLGSDTVASMCEDTERRLWIVGRDGVPRRAVDPTNRSFVCPPDGIYQRATVTVAADNRGNVWLGRYSGNLVQWYDGAFHQEPFRDPVTALLVDRAGHVWAASISGGLFCYRNGVVESFPQDGGLVQPRALAEDIEGAIWAGTEAGGVFRRKADRFEPVALPGAAADQPIRFIVSDQEGCVWIGAMQGGLYRWREGRVTRLPDSARLDLGDPRLMLVAPDGNFWIGTGTRLVRVARSEINAAMDGAQREIFGVVFGREEGLPSLEFSYGFRNAALRTSDGRLWFATNRGALAIDPRKIGEAPPLGRLRIEGISVDDKPFFAEVGGEVVLPPRPGAVELRYTLPQLEGAERLRFRYRLRGLDDNWYAVGNQRIARFIHLPSGRYFFEVAVTDAARPWLSETISLPLSVRMIWWETLWFRAGVGLAGAGVIFLVARRIVRRRIAARMFALEQRHALERERSRIARDMHDEVGASLTQIVLVSDLAGRDAVKDLPLHLSEIARTARRTVESLDEIVWAVNPRYDTLSALLEYLGKFAVGFLRTGGIACELDFPANPPALAVSSTARHHLFLVAKEALNNVVRHAEAKRVCLRAEILERHLRLVIADDGVGFLLGDEAGDANGLRNMRERMSELGGECRTETGAGAGTRIIVEFPLTSGRR